MLTAKDWPTHLDFQEALSNTAVCFDDSDLKTGEVRKNALGFPVVATGGFASVYRVSKGGKQWAVRCFTSPIPPDARERYSAISAHLTQAALPYTVGFAFDPVGIRIVGEMYPTVKMEWIEATSLNRYVRSLVASGDQESLNDLIARWAQLSNDLASASIAHGDLQHGNVLITRAGELRLIDYDGMFVPALRGRTATELGHPSYQHPRRTSSHFDGDLDRYSLLTAFTALHALCNDPELWAEYDNEENLLFVPDDHIDPGGSPLFARLLTMPSPVNKLATALANSASGEPTATPTLAAALNYAAPLRATAAGGTPRARAATGRAWFKVAAAAQAGKQARPKELVSWSPDLHPVWSRPGIQIVHWTEQEPVFQTVTRRETQIRHPLRRLFRATEVVVERTEKVKTGTRPVAKQRLEHIGGGPVLAGVAVLGDRLYGLAGDHLSLWTSASATSPQRTMTRVDATEAVAAAGNVVAVAHRRGITILAAGAPRQIARDGDSRFYAVGVSPSGKYVAAGLGRQAASVYMVGTGTKLARFSGFRRKVQAVTFAGEERLLAGSDDSTVALFEIKSRRKVASSAAHLAPITALGANPSGTLLASGDANGDIHLYDANLRDLGAIHLGAPVRDLAFAPDGQHIVAAVAEGPVTVINVRSHRTVAKLSRGPDAVGLGFTADGDLVTAHPNGLLVRWSNDPRKPEVDLLRVRIAQLRPPATTPQATRWPTSRGASRASRRAPSCPRCGRTMVVRTRRNPPRNQFWGCPRFPKCRGLRSM